MGCNSCVNNFFLLPHSLPRLSGGIAEIIMPLGVE